VGGAGEVATLIVPSLLYFINFVDRSIMAAALTPNQQTFSPANGQAGLLAMTIIDWCGVE